MNKINKLNFCCLFSFFSGALLFVISDTVLSFDLFIHNLAYSHPVIMFTYYAAQLGITLSIVDSHHSHEVNHRVIKHHDLINGLGRVYKYLRSAYLEDSIQLINLDEKNKHQTNKLPIREKKSE